MALDYIRNIEFGYKGQQQCHDGTEFPQRASTMEDWVTCVISVFAMIARGKLLFNRLATLR